MKTGRFSRKDEIDWVSFERNKIAGFYNVFDHRSQVISGLTKERYEFILMHYEEIKKQVKKKND